MVITDQVANMLLTKWGKGYSTRMEVAALQMDEAFEMESDVDSDGNDLEPESGVAGDYLVQDVESDEICVMSKEMFIHRFKPTRNRVKPAIAEDKLPGLE